MSISVGPADITRCSMRSARASGAPPISGRVQRQMVPLCSFRCRSSSRSASNGCGRITGKARTFSSKNSNSDSRA